MASGTGFAQRRFCLLALAIWMLFAVQASGVAVHGRKCRVWRDTETISIKDNPKCEPAIVKLGMCSGRCRSYAFPNTSNQKWEPFVQECSCCSPKKVRQKKITFRGCDRELIVTDIRSCDCKKCSLK